MGNKSSFRWKVMRCTDDDHGTPVIVQVRRDNSTTRTASDNPKYKYYIQNRLNANNSMTVVALRNSWSRALSPTIWRFAGQPGNKDGKYYPTGFRLPIASVSQLDPTLATTAQNAAIVKMYTKLRREQESFNGLTVLGEFRETLHGIRHPAQAVGDYLNALANKTNYLALKHLPVDSRKMSKLSIYQQVAYSQRVRKRQKHAPAFDKAVAESVLEFNFGIAPLLNDISDIANASLRSVVDDEIVFLNTYGSAESGTVGSTTDAGAQFCTWSWSSHSVLRAEAHYRVAIRRNRYTNSNALRNLAQWSGLTYQNIVPAAWELLPWSFFADYFSNIGDVLNAACVQTDNVMWSCHTLREYADFHYYHAVPLANGTQTLVSAGSSGAVSSLAKRVSRIPTALGYPTLQFSLPGRNSQFLNLAALARLCIFQ